MRTLKTIVALAAVSLAASVVAAAPALADPPTHHGKIIAPRYYDVVGVGADTDDTLLDQLAADYDAAHHKHQQDPPLDLQLGRGPAEQPERPDAADQGRSQAARRSSGLTAPATA